MKTIFKVIWLSIFLILSLFGTYNIIINTDIYIVFKWFCFTAMGITISILIFWSLIYKYFEK